MRLTPETVVEMTGAEASRDMMARLGDSATRVALQSPGFVRLTMRIQPVDLLIWLNAQEVVSKFYWRSRDRAVEIAALTLPRFGLSIPSVTPGMLYGSSSNQIGSADETDFTQLRAFNSFNFHGLPRFDTEPQSVNAARTYNLPDIEIITAGSETRLNCTLQHSADIDILREGLRGLDWENVEPPVIPSLSSREETASRLQWAVAVNRAVAAIERKELEKVVLARRSVCTFTDILSPWIILKRLRDSNPDSYLFGIDRKPHDPFIGASPERLYRRNGRLLESEAVAGTRPRGKNPEEEKRFRDDLLHSSKDRKEHQLVIQGILEALRPLTNKIEIAPEPSVVRLSRVQHLAVAIRAELRPGVSDDELLRALQPTPAVGGYPREKAIAMISVLEPFDRGPYAGPIGWVSHDSAEFSVGIRSAVIRKDQMWLFGGAGIVQGSDPDAEWDEIDQKFNTFASILTAQ